MKGKCPICDSENEVEYYIKRKLDLVVLNITLNIKCKDCGSLFHLTDNTSPIKESKAIYKIKDAKENATYIG